MRLRTRRGPPSSPLSRNFLNLHFVSLRRILPESHNPPPTLPCIPQSHAIFPTRVLTQSTRATARIRVSSTCDSTNPGSLRRATARIRISSTCESTSPYRSHICATKQRDHIHNQQRLYRKEPKSILSIIQEFLILNDLRCKITTASPIRFRYFEENAKIPQTFPLCDIDKASKNRLFSFVGIYSCLTDFAYNYPL